MEGTRRLGLGDDDDDDAAMDPDETFALGRLPLCGSLQCIFGARR